MNNSKIINIIKNVTIILISFCFLIFFSFYKQEIPTYEQSLKESQNVFISKPLSFNTQNKTSYYYLPSEFYIESRYDSITNLRHNESAFTLYIGDDVIVTQELIASINSNKKSMFEDNKIDEKKNSYTFKIWNSELDSEFEEVLISKNDSYIYGVIKRTNRDKYVSLMSNIINSIKKEIK